MGAMNDTAKAQSGKLPAFTLADLSSAARVFPTGRDALLCFVKEDCPTCGLTMPLIEAVSRAFGAKVDVIAIGQDDDGNRVLAKRHSLSCAMLDDSALNVSFAYRARHRADRHPRRWRRSRNAPVRRVRPRRLANLVAHLAQTSGLAGPAIDWQALPEQRPGCGSKSVEPEIAERLEAEARGDRMLARRIEIGEGEDVFEFMFERGLTDGLPVIPPTPERVGVCSPERAATRARSIATLPPNLGPLTIEKIAVNAVMAGCRPDYLPVVIAAIEAVAPIRSIRTASCRRPGVLRRSSSSTAPSAIASA